MIERREGWWLWVGGPVPPGSDGITLGPLVCVRRHRGGDRHLIDHELVHVAQWRDLGVIGFLWRYLGAYGRLRVGRYPHRAAYRRIPLEIEAAWVARTVREAPPLRHPCRAAPPVR